MKWYLVSLHGQNLYLNYKGDLAKYSFHTKCYVQANDEREAEIEALQKIMDDRKFQSIVQNEDDDPPTMSVESLQEVDKPVEDLSEDVKNLFYKEHEA